MVIHIQPQLNYNVQNIARPPPHDIEMGHPSTGDVNAMHSVMVETTLKPRAFAFIVSDFQHVLGNPALFLAPM